MKKKFLSVALSITVFLILLTGCSGDGPSGTVSGSDWTPGQTSVKLLGGSWYSENGHVYVFYSVEATNKGSRSFNGSTMDITCLDENGHSLCYQSPSVYPIAPGDTIRYSGSFDYFGTAPSSLDVHFVDNLGMYYYDENVSRHSEFVIDEINMSSSDMFYIISGTVINNSSEKQGVQVSAIFKQAGKIVGGQFGYSGPIEAGKSGSFTIYLPHAFEKCDLYEITANAYYSYE